jgi:hypothetical protein
MPTTLQITESEFLLHWRAELRQGSGVLQSYVCLVEMSPSLRSFQDLNTLQGW